jgi:membrane-bound lytic murein transglycosylase B
VAPPQTVGEHTSGPVAPSIGAYRIPAIVLKAYRLAARSADQADPGCHLSWALLAAIGKVESDHAENGNVLPNGDMRDPIFGPALNGTNGYAAIRDGSGWVRAEGPMQFLPTSWARWGTGGDGDSRADPQNVYDATAAAARYLCASGLDLADQNNLPAVVFTYNPSQPYVDTVLAWFDAYQNGVSAGPDEPVDLMALPQPPGPDQGDEAQSAASASAPAPRPQPVSSHPSSAPSPPPSSSPSPHPSSSPPSGRRSTPPTQPNRPPTGGLLPTPLVKALGL